jgi:WD40 repeat protein/serine/threonine protein kinase
MSGSSTDEFELLPLDVVLQIDAIARRVEHDLRGGGTPRIEDSLALVSEDGRGALLAELLSLELQYLDARGETWKAEGYLDRFPDAVPIVRRVLACHDEPESPTSGEQRSSGQSAESQESDRPRSRELPNVTGYQILRQLGRGAMGVVYLARDERLNRLVALKFMAAHFNFDQARSVVRAEAEIIARLKHPHIVQVYEFGEERNEPFLALEYIDGETLQDRMLREPLSTRKAAELVLQLAHAIHHAHTQGIIHRDLKPANVLLAAEPATVTNLLAADSARRDRPSANGSHPHSLVPKISDFGLAKVLDAFYDQTRAGAFVGTPKYMSPEQAAGNSRDVGPATDIYSLGTILFELLAGRAPFESQSAQELMRQIISDDPSFPTRDVPLSRDLQAICLKCLEKEPERRYSSAEMLAQDLQRYLQGHPVQAQPPSRIDHAVKFIRRNRAFVSAVSIALASLLATSIAVSAFAWREVGARRDAEALARREVAARREADELRRGSRRNLYLANVRLAHNAWNESRLEHMRNLLSQAHPQLPGDEDLRGFEWSYLWGLARDRGMTLTGHAAEVRAVAFRPDGQLLATTDWDGIIRLWNVQSGQLVRELCGPRTPLMDVGFSLDGRRLVAVGADAVLQIWDPETGELLHTLEGHTNWIYCLAFHPDGDRFLTADDREMIREWRLDNGQPVWTVKQPHLYVMDADYSPDGRTVALAGSFSDIRILSAADGSELSAWRAHDVWMTGVDFSPTGKQLASSGGDGIARVWDVETNTEQFALRDHMDWITAVHFNHDGKQLVTSSRDGTLRTWNAENGRPELTLKGHKSWVMSCTFSPDGTKLVSGGRDGIARIWPAEVDPESTKLWEHENRITGVAISADAQQLVAVTYDGQMALFDAAGQLRMNVQTESRSPMNRVAISPDGKTIAATNHFGEVILWNSHDGSKQAALTPHHGPARGVGFSKCGKRFATTGNDGLVNVYDMPTRKLVHVLRGHGPPGRAVAFHPNGKLLATCGEDHAIRLWDVETGEPLQTWLGHTDIVADLSFNAAGDRVASGGEDQTVRIWDVANGDNLLTLHGHANVVTQVSWSPDGRRLASSSHDRSVRLWDAASGKELLTLRISDDWVNGVVFDPSGTRIIAASQDHSLRIIDAGTSESR